MQSDFVKGSYERHRDHYQQLTNTELIQSWCQKNTVDHWRHARMYATFDPIIKSFPEASWLTIGDGRYGTDANYLLSKNVKDVLATDISETYLKTALEEKFISKYSVENAEALSFADKTFDFVLCKEAFHHLAQPMVGLYEMLRVARKGVILIEPQDKNILIPSRYTLQAALLYAFRAGKDLLKSLLGKPRYYHYGNYEEVGNYVYTISEREIEKVALGLNLPAVSFKGINDLYLEGVEFEPADKSSEKFRTIKARIRQDDRRTERGIIHAGLLAAIILKDIDDTLLTNLEGEGFVNHILPRNPYA